ncbi:hypothetical protein LRY29_00050 [Candidatus Saccharibacteria bacterium]|nr:hypothetical protein [Candidatus Saccharibacteria bacterium]
MEVEIAELIKPVAKQQAPTPQPESKTMAAHWPIDAGAKAVEGIVEAPEGEKGATEVTAEAPAKKKRKRTRKRKPAAAAASETKAE